MKKAFLILLLILTGILHFSFIDSAKSESVKHPSEDTLAAERKKYIAIILDSLKGRETTAADSVFQNLQTFDASHRLQVRHLLSVMNYWGESLGVNCTYCHHSGNWDSDDHRTKRIAREMYRMRQIINKEIIPKMADLQSRSAVVNCVTCHNGKPFPEK